MDLIAGIVGAIVAACIGAYFAFRERKSGIENAGKLSEVSGYVKSEQEVKQVESEIEAAKREAGLRSGDDLRNW